MYLDDLIARLVAQGVGVAGTSIFAGSAAAIPSGTGPYLSVSETGGVAPTRVQDKQGANTRRPTAQILARAATYASARTMANAAYAALDGVSNTTINGVFYIRIGARQEPTDMGEDASGRPQIVFNVETEFQP